MFRCKFRHFAASNVDSAYHWFEMKWIHAGRITTEMVDLMTGWNLSDKIFVEDTVGVLVPYRFSVTVRIAIAGPYPAAAGIQVEIREYRQLHVAEIRSEANLNQTK